MHDKYRFHKSFVMLVILFDAVDHPHDQQMFRHLGYDEKKCVYRFAGLGDLPDEAGIYLLEISQPAKNSIDETARASTKMLKAARPIDQFENTTANILKMICG